MKILITLLHLGIVYYSSLASPLQSRDFSDVSYTSRRAARAARLAPIKELLMAFAAPVKGVSDPVGFGPVILYFISTYQDVNLRAFLLSWRSTGANGSSPWWSRYSWRCSGRDGDWSWNDRNGYWRTWYWHDWNGGAFDWLRSRDRYCGCGDTAGAHCNGRVNCCGRWAHGATARYRRSPDWKWRRWNTWHARNCARHFAWWGRYRSVNRNRNRDTGSHDGSRRTWCAWHNHADAGNNGCAGCYYAWNRHTRDRGCNFGRWGRRRNVNRNRDRDRDRDRDAGSYHNWKRGLAVGWTVLHGRVAASDSHLGRGVNRWLRYHWASIFLELSIGYFYYQSRISHNNRGKKTGSYKRIMHLQEFAVQIDRGIKQEERYGLKENCTNGCIWNERGWP